jgi:hypothetical protein
VKGSRSLRKLLSVSNLRRAQAQAMCASLVMAVVLCDVMMQHRSVRSREKPVRPSAKPKARPPLSEA